VFLGAATIRIAPRDDKVRPKRYTESKLVCNIIAA